ncbi:peroxisomal biogenesis factor 19 [Pseudohyphozyma bogoriensis]|nr:peroxisomal biogenesis factor 19 [Pseudohyphozyma bogoriensis]
MPPRPADDDDLDDLDDLVDEFHSSPATAKPPASTPPVPSSSSSSTAPTPAPAADSDDFPDPDDEPLQDLSEDDLAKEFEAGMQQLLGELGGAGGDDDDAFKKMMQDIIKGGGLGEDAFLKALGGEGGEDELLKAFGAGAGAGVGGSASAGDKGKKASTSGSAKPSGEKLSFQETIAQSMAKMKESGSTVDAETSARAEKDGDPMAAMMAQLAGLDMGEEGLQGMLDEMMGQLLTREMLYDPLKELGDKYPEYLEKNASTLSEADLTRFKKQQQIVNAIVAKFEEPGADKTENLTPAEEEKAKVRSQQVADLVKEMNDCGAPPAEIMGSMPEGMELGPDGVPKLPSDCIIS